MHFYLNTDQCVVCVIDLWLILQKQENDWRETGKITLKYIFLRLKQQQHVPCWWSSVSHFQCLTYTRTHTVTHTHLCVSALQRTLSGAETWSGIMWILQDFSIRIRIQKAPKCWVVIRLSVTQRPLDLSRIETQCFIERESTRSNGWVGVCRNVRKKVAGFSQELPWVITISLYWGCSRDGLIPLCDHF